MLWAECFLGATGSCGGHSARREHHARSCERRPGRILYGRRDTWFLLLYTAVLSLVGWCAGPAAFEFEREMGPETRRLQFVLELLRIVISYFTAGPKVYPFTCEIKQSYGRGMEFTSPHYPVPPGAKKGQLPLGELKSNCFSVRGTGRD